MFNIWVDYPSYEEELDIVKATTTDNKIEVNNVMDAEEIIFFQRIKRIYIIENK